MYPNKKLPSIAPTGGNDAIHDASVIEILPDGSGESTDVSKFTLGLAHPAVIPKPIGSMFTVCDRASEHTCAMSVCAKMLTMNN